MTEGYKVQIPFHGTITKQKLLRLLADVPDEMPVRIVMKVACAKRGVEIATNAGDENVHLSLAPTSEYGTHIGCTLFAYCPKEL